MKTILLLLLPLSVFAQTYDHASEQEFFDDFSYSSSTDSRIADFGWDLMNRPGWPGYQAPVMYSNENIRFVTDTDNPANTLMEVSTQTTNNLADRSFARIQYSEFIFLHGTYAARMKFDNTPALYGDGNIQTFYAIKNAENSPAHAEIDFEYLPYDVWGGGNTNKAMYLTTWESYVNVPWSPVKAYDVFKKDYADVWHTVIFTAKDNEIVSYYIDGVEVAQHTVADQDGVTSVYPDSKMQVAFANWIWSNATTGIGSSTDLRKSTIVADWVYHSKNTDLPTSSVESIVSQFKNNGVERLNTLVNNDPPTVSFIEGRFINSQVAIDFQSQFESDVISYEMEFSTDGVNFSFLESRTPSNNGKINYYGFTDTQNDVGYYRVKTIKNGSIDYSKPVFINGGLTSTDQNSEIIIDLFPNPSSNSFNSNIKVDVDIYDLQGRIIDRQFGVTNFGGNLIIGIYTAHIYYHDSIKIYKIIKTN